MEMNSSDSGEDFESADEDFDPDNSKCMKSQSKNLSNAKSEGILVENSLKEIDEKVPIEEFNSLQLKVENSLKEIDEKVPIEEFNSLQLKETQDTLKCSKNASDNVQDSAVLDNSNTNRVDNVKVKPSSKKLGTRLTGNTKLDISCVPNKSEDTKEKKECKISLGIKTGKESQHIDNIKPIVTSLQTQSVEHEEKLSIKSINSEYKSSDGWEIEEDGFSIPSTLAKSPDMTIQNDLEQFDTLEKIKQSSNEQEDIQGWGGWGGWGVSSLISTATGSVSTFSSQVSAGLSTVLETTVGAPDAETLAAAIAGTSEQTDEPSVSKEDKTLPSYGGLGTLVSGVSFVSSTVINRGLDTLESLGKKTMEVLQEGDPGLMKKRAMLFPNQEKPLLSQILHEAKEKAEHSDKEKEEKETARKVHFESIFDDFHGMVHLEALKMLSTQCELKLQSQMQSLSGDQLTDFQETLAQVKDLCELSEEEEDIPELSQEQFAEHITRYVNGLKVKISAAKIINVNSEIVNRLDSLKTESATVVNQTAISSVAEFTAAAMECFHKSAELLLAKSLHNTPEEAESYVQLTNLLCARTSVITNEFTQLLTNKDPIANSSMITNIFLEASSSSTYINNACQLLVPILQVGALSS
uniref:Protein FAM114A2 n=1 Tax=Cuerna arida TaxID=1464854 RepID=A0A1B6FJM3_9HEMI